MAEIDLSAAASAQAVADAVTRSAADIADSGVLTAHHGELASVRTATYRGHRIVIRTTYEIEVDGKPFRPHVGVDNSGRVHYHGLPTRDFASMITLVETAIESYPEFFSPPGPEGPAGPGHGHGPGHHEHGE